MANFDNDNSNDGRGSYGRSGRMTGGTKGRQFGEHHSTQDFQNQNAMQFNRGKEGDQNWRAQDYDQQDYRNDFSESSGSGYGEHYGNAAYGRAQYNPEQNRGMNDGNDSWSEKQSFNNREQDYRGGDWNRSSHDYQNRSANGEGHWGSASRQGNRGYENDDDSRGSDQGRRMSRAWGEQSGGEQMRGGRSQGSGGQDFQRGIPSGMEQFGGGSSQSYGRYSNSGNQSYSGGGQGWGSGQSSSRGLNMDRMSGYGTMAQYGRGEHSGKGPKNYKRSDARIEEDICERLTQHPDVDASEIEITVKDGEVTLSGTVSDRSMKRAAEDAIDDVRGVKEVNNQLRVSQGNQSGQSQSASSSSSQGNGQSANGNGSSSSNGNSNSRSSQSSTPTGSSASNGNSNGNSNGHNEDSTTSKQSKTKVS